MLRSKLSKVAGVACATALCFLVMSFEPAGAEEITVLQPDNHDDNDHFGISVSADGEYAVVGAEYDETQSVGPTGSATFLYLNPGGQGVLSSHRAVPSDGEYGDMFGYSVSIVSQHVVIGAPESLNYGPGAAYYFINGANQAPIEVDSITPSEQSCHEFGYSVSIVKFSSGYGAAVGAPGDTEKGTGAGAAYAYWLNGRFQQKSRLLPDGSSAAGDRFGASVDLTSGYVVVGAPGDDDRGADAGAVYVYPDGYPENKRKLLPFCDGSENVPGGAFGTTVAIHGTLIVVGAPKDGEFGTYAGALYLFRTDDEQYAEKIACPVPGSRKFGSRVDISGNLMIVAADEMAEQSVWVYRFSTGQWGMIDRFYDPDLTYNYFGSDVGVSDSSGGFALVGAFRSFAADMDAGAAFLFSHRNTISVTGSENGSVTGAGTYTKLLPDVTLEAQPDPGFTFLYWSGDISTDANPVAPALVENISVAAHFAKTDRGVLLDFNDQSWNTRVSGDTRFHNALAADEESYAPDTGCSCAGATFEYNTRGGTALAFSDDAESTVDFSIAGPAVGWSRKFALETYLRRSSAAEGTLSLVRDRNAAEEDVLHWYVDGSGEKLYLRLNDWDGDGTGGTLLAVTNTSSGDPILPSNEWTFLRVIVDLTQAELTNAVLVYRNAEQVPLLPATEGAGGEFTGDFAAGEGMLELSGSGAGFMKRDVRIGYMCDFLKLTSNITGAFGTDDFYGGEVFTTIGQNASGAILVHPPTVMRRVKNSMKQIDAMPRDSSGKASVEYDTHPDPVGVFHGVFEVRFAIETRKFDGTMFTDIYMKKAGETDWRRIGVAKSGPKPPPGSTWWVTYYWDSRATAYDWDGLPYRTQADENVQLKFELR